MVMKKLILILLIAVLLVSTVAMAAIEASASKNGSDNKKEPQLEKIVFIHYKKGYAKPSGATKQPTCYKFLTPTKVRWQTLPVSYTINPTNPQGLQESFITSAVQAAAETWDANTSKELMNDAYKIDYNVAYGVQDYVNAITFGNYPEEGVIAVTTVWYNPVTKAIVEFDIMFDTDWVWGDATVNSTVMDLQNIATHEFGHGIGLGDVYDSACSEVTMYGYSDYGEVKKRTLEQPDITGLQTLYGA
jgi:hypothetical protein